MVQPVTATEPLPVDMEPFADSWLLHLRAEHRSPQTIKLYMGVLRDLSRFLASRGMPTDPTLVSGEHLREYLVDQLARGLATKTVRSRHGFLSVFFRWMVEEGERSDNPMVRIKPPKLDEVDPPMVSDEQFAAMLKACEGRDFDDRRDMAILRLLEDTGIRRAECASLTLEHLDLREQTIIVMGKGRRERTVPFTSTTAVAIDRYLRDRARRRYAKSGALFLARTGPMSPNAIGEVVYRRARMAGLVDGNRRELVSPHMFRHRFADRWKHAGGSEEALMALGGWRNREIMQRYGRVNAASRAMDEYRRIRGGQ